MRTHNSHDSIERFSMGRLEGAELADFEMHLLQCQECQDSVHAMDLLLDGIRVFAEDLRQNESPRPGLLVTTRFTGEYLLVQAALPNSTIENIGILLLDTDSDRLYCRFRRDFEEFAGRQADWFKQLADDVSEKANELGGQKCVEWLESTLLNTVGISISKSVLLEDYAMKVDGLYAKHIRPKILPFRTHLPQYSLEAAAGKFGKQMSIEPEGWVEVRKDIPLTEDMFVTHVKGHSMEPQIPDPSLCAFRANFAAPLDGKVLLIEQYGESGGSRYTIKQWNVSKNVDPNQEGDEAWLHQRVTLKSSNPDYESWDVASAGKIRALGEFLFVL